MEKLVTVDDIAGVLDPLRAAGKTIVSVNGCFDLIHACHVRMLRAARQQGDILVVGLNSDASIQALKGIQRPILPQADRLEVICALEMVDYVVVFDEPDCCGFVAAVKADVHVNDASYGTNCIEAEIVQANGGRLHLIEKIPGLSTTDIIRKIEQLRQP